jgi:hypothetical protein
MSAGNSFAFISLAHHKSLNHNTINTLEAHYENCLWTLFRSPEKDERLLN